MLFVCLCYLDQTVEVDSQSSKKKSKDPKTIDDYLDSSTTNVGDRIAQGHTQSQAEYRARAAREIAKFVRTFDGGHGSDSK